MNVLVEKLANRILKQQRSQDRKKNEQIQTSKFLLDDETFDEQRKRALTQMNKIDKFERVRQNKKKIEQMKAMNLKMKMSKPLIVPSETLDDSTVDEITGKMTKTDLYTTNPKWNQFDKKLNFVDSSVSNHRASFDIFNSGSYLKNESIRSTIFFEQSRKMASTLGST